MPFPAPSKTSFSYTHWYRRDRARHFEDLSKHNLVFDPEDRRIQYDFWKRYIGDSRSRLIQTFNDYLMPPGIYEQDPKPFVTRKIAVETLRELFERLPDDDGMKDLPSKYLRRMKKFLDGAYERGIGIDLANGEPDEPHDDELSENLSPYA